MDQSKFQVIEIDLARSTLIPSSKELFKVTQRFHQLLSEHLAVRGLEHEWIKEAHITMSFEGGEAFECVVALTDDMGRVHAARGTGKCWPHDPASETKSARALQDSSRVPAVDPSAKD